MLGVSAPNAGCLQVRVYMSPTSTESDEQLEHEAMLEPGPACPGQASQAARLAGAVLGCRELRAALGVV